MEDNYFSLKSLNTTNVQTSKSFPFLQGCHNTQLIIHKLPDVQSFFPVRNNHIWIGLNAKCSKI